MGPIWPLLGAGATGIAAAGTGMAGAVGAQAADLALLAAGTILAYASWSRYLHDAAGTRYVHAGARTYRAWWYTIGQDLTLPHLACGNLDTCLW